jgi:hypothetical protein
LQRLIAIVTLGAGTVSGSSILMPQADDRNWPIPYLTWSGFDPFDMFSSARKTHRFEKHFCAGHE